MELIYLYIKKFNGTVKNQEINFSPNFNVKIMNKKLNVEKKASYMDQIYPKSVKNITMLLGKNGSGKTTILDILGMNMDDRCNESIKRKDRPRSEVVDSYFILYHIQEEYFGIEIMDEINPEDKITKLFQNNLMNFNFDKINNMFNKVPIGLVVKKDGDNFEVVGNLVNPYPPLGYSVNEHIRISYISNSNSNRVNMKNAYIGKDKDKYETDCYLCKRRYYLEATNEMKYKFINKLNKDDYLKFKTNLATIKIEPNFNYALQPGITNKEMEKWIEELEKKLYINKIDSMDEIEMSNNNLENQNIKISDNKKLFMLDLVSRYIIYQFVEYICEMVKYNLTRENCKEGLNIDFSNSKHLSFLNNLKKKEYIQFKSTSLLGDLLNKRKEYENLIEVIDYYNKDEDLKSYNKLICVSRYLYSRMENSLPLDSLGKDRYQIAIEDFFSALNCLKESYFYKKEIYIECNSGIDDEALVKLFRIYDNYLRDEYNDLNRRFNIRILNLSEGENNFLDLLSKISDTITKSKKNQLSIILLDEPDQSLHPEWSRQFIKFLCDEIGNYKNKNIQIVLSTHSPFMTTDIMSEHIYCLENINYINNQEESKISIYSMNEKKHTIHNTFGDNIHSLLKDGFFMDNTIGEFANQKIKAVAKDLTERTAEEIIKETGRKKEIEYIIKNIGEPVIKRKLENMYNRKFDYVDMNNKIEELSNKVKELEKIIKENGLQ